MKKGGVLHPLLAQVLASLGHGDLLVVADAGLPIPPGPLRIDLAYAPGRPPFLDVVRVLLQEIEVEGAVLAQEIRDKSPELYRHLEETLREVPGLDMVYVPHEHFKELVNRAKGVVRTGSSPPTPTLFSGRGWSSDGPLGDAGNP